MCGIVGLIAKSKSGFWNSSSDLFSDMIVCDSIRGYDSTGVFGIGKQGTRHILKGTANAIDFVQCSYFDKFTSGMVRNMVAVVGHNRKATKGEVKPENSHPFKEGNIVLVHNGTIYNQSDLKDGVEVDSHAIAHALDQHDAPEALNKINGAYALVWHHKKDKTLNLARNSQRPLSLIETKDFWLFASEALMAIWLLKRKNIDIIQGMELSTEKIYTFDLENLGSFVELPYEEYKTKSTVTYPVTNYIPQVSSEKEKVTSLYDKKESLGEKSVGNIKINETVVFCLDDYKETGAGGGYQFWGTPINEQGEMLNNICIRAFVSKRTTDELIDSDYLKGTVASILPNKHYPELSADYIVWLHSNPSVTPVEVAVSKNMTKIPYSKLTKLLKSHVCARCGKEALPEDVEETVIHLKENGRVKVVCKACVNEIQANIDKVQKKTGTDDSLITVH